MQVLIYLKSKTISNIIERSLISYGYPITTIPELNTRIPSAIDLLIIDVKQVLSEEKVQEKLQEAIKRKPELNIFGISTSNNWEDRIEFLKRFGHDVLNYPFPIQELLTRIQLLYRKPKEKNTLNIDLGSIKINTYEHKVFTKKEELGLCRKEYVLLEYMARNRKRPISRSELLDHIWDYKRINSSNTVDVHINRLRKKLGKEAVIKTIHGFGYRID